jgi:hypothetical protein
MEKFLKLLNPWDTREGLGLSVGEQQRRAARLFPNMVRRSNLHYWCPGDPISKEGTRCLIALAASYSLKDLRFSDVINEALFTPFDRPKRIDVFNIDDCISFDDLAQYCPGLSVEYAETPIVGVWEEGVYQKPYLTTKQESMFFVILKRRTRRETLSRAYVLRMQNVFKIEFDANGNGVNA